MKNNFEKRFGEGTAFDLDYGKLLIIALCIYIAVQVSDGTLMGGVSTSLFKFDLFVTRSSEIPIRHKLKRLVKKCYLLTLRFLLMVIGIL